MEDFNALAKSFAKHFRDPIKSLVKYLVDNNIMNKSEIARQMGISRQTLYTKYLGGKDETIE